MISLINLLIEINLKTLQVKVQTIENRHYLLGFN